MYRDLCYNKIMSKVFILPSKEVFRDNEDFFIHLSKEKGSSFPHFIEKLHKHDFIEISYVVSGECEHYQDDRTIIAKKGDIFILNYGMPHSDRIIKSTAEPYLSYDIAFKCDFLDKSLSNETDILKIKSSFLFHSLFPKDGQSDTIRMTGQGFYEFESLFKRMLEEYTERRPGYYDLLRAYTIELLVKLFRSLNVKEPEFDPNSQKQYIRLAIQHIETRYGSELRLEDLAYRSFLSKSYFSQLFKKETGKSFSEYVQQVRIENACRLLKETNLSINDIREKTGFNDLKFFYSVFKRITGHTPKEFRELE